MDIRITRIQLRNFKGVKSLDVVPGNRTAIYGRNATGKTTIFDGFLWCLFGKDSQNSAAFEIKSLDAKGNPAHNQEHSVIVELDVDGRPVTLKKIYAEKYTKKRGSAAAEFTGHTTEYFIDGVPLKEKEYAERVGGIVDEKVFRLLTDPRYFNEVMRWQDRRALLMEVCGDVEIADVVAVDASLAGLSDILNGHNIDDFRKMIASQRKEINDQLQKIPVRIDEAKLSMSEAVPWIDEIPGKLESLNKQRAAIESEIADLRNGGAVSAKRIALQEVETEIRAAKNAFEDNKAARIAPLNKRLDELQDSMSATRRKVRDLEDELASKKNTVASLERLLDNLRNEWSRVDAMPNIAKDHCPTCGQALPSEEVQKAIENANRAKATELARIDASGKERKAEMQDATARISEIEHELAEIKATNTDNTREAVEDLRSQIALIRDEQPITPGGLIEKKNSIIAEIDDIAQSEQGAINEVRGRMEKVITEIRELEAEAHKAATNTRAEQRIAELEIQEKDLSAKFEELEGQLFLCENFIRRKVEILDERINSKFSMVRFKLFADQINGGLQEVCETTLGGVPYNSINNAGRIQAGMDIIKTLQAHYGVTAPIWIDNRESIVDLPEMAGQVISLVVSGQDKALRIETEGETTTKTMKKAGGM